VLFIPAATTAWAHPVLFRRIERRARIWSWSIRARPKPRAAATLHLQIAPARTSPSSNGMLHVILRRKVATSRYVHPPHGGRKRCGRGRYLVPAAAAAVPDLRRDLLDAARLFAQSSATLSLYCQGSTSRERTAKKHGADQPASRTGHIGDRAPVLQLDRQPNAMAGREVAGMAEPASCASATSRKPGTGARWPSSGRERGCREAGKDGVSNCSKPRAPQIKEL